MKSMHPKLFSTRLNIAVLLGLCLMIAGCDTAPLVTRQTPGTDFTRYHSFAVLPAAIPAGRDPARARVLAAVAMRCTISVLVSHGYIEAPTNQAAFVVTIAGQSTPRIPANTGPDITVRTGHGPIPLADLSSDAPLQEDRSLQIQAFDTKSGELIWSGWTKEIFSDLTTIADVERAVNRILKRFPAVAQP